MTDDLTRDLPALSRQLAQALRSAVPETESGHRVALAWEIYCRKTAGSSSARDFWWELPATVQERYLKAADAAALEAASWQRG